MTHLEPTGVPSKLLILTNSLDGTSDLLVKLCAEYHIEVLRFNIDLYLDYDVNISTDEFKISDPVGRTIDLEAYDIKLLWRKPFLETLREGTAPETFPIVRGNMSGVLQAIVYHAKLKHRKPLIEPYFETAIGKLSQLRQAANFFHVPMYEVSIQRSTRFDKQVVTKPLKNPGTSDGRIFYTSKVTAKDLHRPELWFLQKQIIGGTDVTGVYIDGKTWFFECDFVRSETAIDWRVEINTQNQSIWRPWSAATDLDLQVSVDKFMKSMDLRYGRLDFIRDDSGTLWFLECNSNGQFSWLDDESLALHRAFLASAIK